MNVFRRVRQLATAFVIFLTAPCATVAAQSEYAAYLFAYFKGEGQADGEQIYFAVSRDGLHWTDLNNGRPVLTSSLGEKGVRDPFIMRSAAGDKFYVIATDLKIYGNGDWSAAQSRGSQSVMVWESPDLVNWSEQRMCHVAPQGAGCTWAPEAVYDDETGEYMLFWSSKIPQGSSAPNNDNTHRVYCCSTPDFKTFSAPRVWIELKNTSGRTLSAIDATVVKEGDTYYRFFKNEATEAHKPGYPQAGKYILMQKSASLTGQWEDVETGISQTAYREGPTCFYHSGTGKWSLYLDDFGGKGYYPLSATDLSSGQFVEHSASEYSLPSVMRHGSVVGLTAGEYATLMARYDPNHQTVFRIDPSQRQQTMEGWGVSLCWWANMCGKWSDDKVDRLVELLTSPQGLNYNIFRFNIGGGDDPNHAGGHMARGKGIRAEMEGYKPTENGPYDWNADAGQRNVLKRIKKARPDAVFEAFSNSAPYWMTYSGCTAGNANAGSDNLKPAYYSQFCDYLIEVCRHMKEEYGIEFKTLEPFNEPNTNYWGANGGQEGCHFSPQTQIDLLRVLRGKMPISGLNTVVAAADETSVATAVAGMKAYRKENDIVPMLGQYNVHTYEGTVIDRANLREMVKESGLPLWMSETGAGGSGIGGNLSLAQRMMDDLNYLMPQAWVDWQFVEEGNDQWCLVTGNFSRQTYSIVKNYYIRMQVTRFIKQGYTLLTTGHNDVLAAISPDGKEVVMVTINTGTEEKNVVADLSLLRLSGNRAQLYVTNKQLNCERMPDVELNDHTLTLTMGPQEIATVVVATDGYDVCDVADEDIPLQIVPRAASMALSATAEGLELASFSHVDLAQNWHLRQMGTEEYIIYTMKDGREMALTDNGSYYTALEPLDERRVEQRFKIASVGDNCYKIMAKDSGKLLDLEGNSTKAGTRVGLWQAGETGENAHREWRLLSVPFAPVKMTTEIALAKNWEKMPVWAEDGAVIVWNQWEKEAEIVVVNAMGQTVDRGTCAALATFKHRYPEGVYVVECTVDGHRQTTKLIVR